MSTLKKLPFDAKHFMTERVAMHTIMRAPWNTFRHSEFFQLNTIGGPKFRSPNVACAAALFRTAAKTIDCWPEWVRQMKIAAEAHLSVASVCAERHYPSFWDSPSYAHNLLGAFEGFSDQPKFSEAGKVLRSKIMSDNSGMFPAPGGEYFRKTNSLQKTCHSVLMGAIFPDEDEEILGVSVRRRCAKMFAPFEIDFETGVDIDEALACLKSIGSSHAMRVVKSWLNGWATSHRMHEDPQLDCLLGCSDAKDSLSHYVMCPHLYALLKYFCDETPSNPLERFGLKNPSINSLKFVSCTFSAYHALKAKVRCGQIKMQEGSKTKILLRQAWSVFAETLAVEAGECHLSRCAFSLPKFIVFLYGMQVHPNVGINDGLHEDPQ